MNHPMQATERNIPMKDAIESAERNLGDLHSRLVHLDSALRPVLTPENPNGGASCEPKQPSKEESPLVIDVRNLAAGINVANKIIEELLNRLEV